MCRSATGVTAETGGAESTSGALGSTEGSVLVAGVALGEDDDVAVVVVVSSGVLCAGPHAASMRTDAAIATPRLRSITQALVIRKTAGTIQLKQSGSVGLVELSGTVPMRSFRPLHTRFPTSARPA